MGFFSPIFGKAKKPAKDKDPVPAPVSLHGVAAANPTTDAAAVTASTKLADGPKGGLAAAETAKLLAIAHAAARSPDTVPMSVLSLSAAKETSDASAAPASKLLSDDKSQAQVAQHSNTVLPASTEKLSGSVPLKAASPLQLTQDQAVPGGAASKELMDPSALVAASPSETETKAGGTSPRTDVHEQANSTDDHEVLPSPSASSAWRIHASREQRSHASREQPSHRLLNLGGNPLHAGTSGSMAGSEDAGSIGDASGDASGVQSGSAWGLEETARSTVSLPVTALRRPGRARGKSKGSLLYDEVSVQEGDEEGEEDEDDAFSTGQVLDFWAGKRRGAAGRDSMTDAGTEELRRAASSVGRRGDSSMSPRSALQCHVEQVHPHEHESDWERTSSSQVYHKRLPRAASTDSHGQQQAVTMWETMTGHLESMRQKHQGDDDWNAEHGHEPGGNISPRTEPAFNEQHIACEGLLDGEDSPLEQGVRGPKVWDTEEGAGGGCRPSALDVFKEKFGAAVERQDAASCADIEAPADYGDSDHGSNGDDNGSREHDGFGDDAASGGKLSAMTGMSDTALLHLLLQQENRDGEGEEVSSDGDASSDDALSHVPLRNGVVAVGIQGHHLLKSSTRTSEAFRGVGGLLALPEEKDGRECLGEQDPDDAADADMEEEEQGCFGGGIFDGLRDGLLNMEDSAFPQGAAEARLREMLGGAGDDCIPEEEDEVPAHDSQGAAAGGLRSGAPGVEEGKLWALQAAALECMTPGDIQKRAAQAQSLMALRPDMARVAQWLTAVEIDVAEIPPDHLWFATSDAKEDPLVKDKQKPAAPPKVASHAHKKPTVSGASAGSSAVNASPQLAGAMEAAARLLASKDKHLQALYLSAHGLQVVPPTLPSFSHLKTLDLSRNSIASVPAGLLPPSLHILDLSHNRLAAVEGLRDLGRLRLLNLSNNRITRIGHGLVGCTSLRELYLSSNKVGEVEGLHRLLKLQVLDLSCNKVTSTRAVSQLAANEGSLKALNLLSNPIHTNLGNDAFKRFVTGLLPHLQVLNQRPVKATGASRDLIADTHVSSKGIGRSGHHSRNASNRDLRGKASTASRRHGSTSAFPGGSSVAGSSMRHSKSGAHGAGSSRTRHHKSKESSRVSGTRHHGSRLQPLSLVIPPGMDEQALQLLLQQQQHYLLLQQQQLALNGQGTLGAHLGLTGVNVPGGHLPALGSSEGLGQEGRNLMAG